MMQLPFQEVEENLQHKISVVIEEDLWIAPCFVLSGKTQSWDSAANDCLVSLIFAGKVRLGTGNMDLSYLLHLLRLAVGYTLPIGRCCCCCFELHRHLSSVTLEISLKALTSMHQ